MKNLPNKNYSFYVKAAVMNNYNSFQKSNSVDLISLHSVLEASSGFVLCIHMWHIKFLLSCMYSAIIGLSCVYTGTITSVWNSSRVLFGLGC